MEEQDKKISDAAKQLAGQAFSQNGTEDIVKKQEEEFQKLLNTPIGEDEAKKLLADNDVSLAQLEVVRVKKLDELNQIDTAIKMAKFDRSVVFRRALNKKED